MKARSVCPEEVRDEVLLPARGDTVYWLCLSDELVEILARGECPEAVSQQAFSMLGWKRLNARAGAQQLHICRQPGYDPGLHRCLGCVEAGD